LAFKGELIFSRRYSDVFQSIPIDNQL